MRLMELKGKEVINIHDGSRLGTLGEGDLIIDIETGEIKALVLPGPKNVFSVWGKRQELVIPWEAVHKVGTEVITVDFGPP
ncbi:MAG: YlmC/YmxH family sporulation protein [Thermanaeromonas sp.]|uniref:YlmC/YmxH family sporulation protein n=1 Tax=Thermanaeromonas sp. TaxID=2003697 RepID=UPI00243A0D3A|nr:YlmC/YmxH family sporulation protein [Thermanaeromonas sp.]MCG0277276.1 YlmC/YmxH family sporulation protein [Thermanaeromonas sp.]